jgi:MFS family permease
MKISPSRTLLAVGVGTWLSLLGDTTLYSVLPTHTAEAGIAVASLGIILSANRFVRLALNGPLGILYDRWRRRPLFISALFIGALSTLSYGFSQGFWPLLAGRLLWGLSWAGIWVGGNTIILDITTQENRGRRMGYYQAFFFVGAASGSIFGGFLTDLFGYHLTMKIHASLTLLGALVALFLLPETKGTPETSNQPTPENPDANPPETARQDLLITATVLYSANRLVIAGMLTSTLGLFFLQQLGESIALDGGTVGVATLTGLALGVSTLLAMASAPAAGILSDRMASRWQTIASGLAPGVVGFSLLAVGSPLAILVAIPLAAITSGSNQNLATTLVGDTVHIWQRGRRLGLLFTFGDLASAVGPLLAYALIPVVGLRGVYLLCAALFGLILLAALRLATRPFDKASPLC